MRLKINIKARLERHARNSHVFNKKHFFSILKKFKLFSLFIVLILPVYPSFGAFGVNEETAVGNYDESTIITAYEGDSEDVSVFSKESGFVRPHDTLDDTRDVSGINQLLTYTVANGDSMGSIAAKFNVNINSIIWANDLNGSSVLHPGDTIKIPPVSGLIYSVAAGETMQAIADKYKVDISKIAQQNRLAVGQELLIGQQIIVPGAIKLAPPKVVPRIATTTTSPVKKPGSSKAVAKAPSKKTYAVSYTGKGNKFAWGNCTYFVANHKNITWRGNASAWLRNAASAGVPTGSTATAGAIISFQGSGYNPYYGHVGLVVDVDGDDVIVKDMNYRRINEVTIRRVPKDDPSIKGYIYAN